MIKILYVEDTPASQRLVQRVLMVEGFDVSVASNGIEAIELARQEKPELILMDINIGGMDGYEVTTRLRTIEGLAEVPIVAVTAATLNGDRERALVAGCAGYIAKPIDVDTFPDQVREFLTGTKKEEVGSAEKRAEYLQEYNQRLVTRLEEKVRELEAVNKDLQRVEKMKSDFVILAGHELRTPLTVIYGYLQILLSNPAIPGTVDDEGTPRHLLKKISQAVERLSQVIQDILNVSLIDADRLDLAHEPVFISSTIKTVLHNLRSFGPQRQLIFEIAPGLKKIPVIEGDPRRLHQAIWNVISNAIKYTPDNGSITIDGEVIESQTAHIWITDTGIGIPAEELTHIFKRFYVLEDVSLHRSSKTAFKGGGMGLGLSVAKGIIEAHGGKIWAESVEQDETKLPGSTIHLLLPLGNVSMGLR
ncbi:MAG: ATP-binding protein [Chloroflexota bacterium]|nr:ATP-binding protein [Chloroflexota bacterium]